MGRAKYLPNYIFFLKGLMGMVWELQREPVDLTQVALPTNDTPYGDDETEQAEQAEQAEERDYDSLKSRYDSLKSRYDSLLEQRNSLAGRYEYLHKLYQGLREQADECHSKAMRYENMMKLLSKYAREVGKPPYPVLWNDDLYFAVPTKFTVDRAVDHERVYLAPKHHRRRVNGYFLFQNGAHGRIFLVDRQLKLVPHPHAIISGICTGSILDDYNGDDIVEMAKLLEAGMTTVNLNSLLEPNAKGYEPFIGITRGDIPFGWEVSQAWQGARHYDYDTTCRGCGYVIDPEEEEYYRCDYCDGYLCAHGCDYTSEDGGTYCEPCYYETYERCESCNVEVLVNDACYAEVDGYPYCEGCYHEKFTRCHVCDMELYLDCAESCDECGQDVCEYCSTSETDSETGVLIITCRECR